MSKVIAWIEDDVDVIYPVVRPLEKAGYQIITFRNAKEALKSVKQIRKADLILLDMLLPPGQTGEELNHYAGLSLLRELREVHKVSNRVVVFTVVTPDNLMERLRELGVADIVRKPILPSELKERIERALANQE
jgi:CheY-like chemotaxis protein